MLAAVGRGNRQHGIRGLGEVLGQITLGNVAGRAALKRLDGDLFTAEGGHENDRHQRAVFPHLDDQLQTVHLRHLKIGQNEVGRVLDNHVKRLAAVLGERDLHVGALGKQGPCEVPVNGVIVHHQN